MLSKSPKSESNIVCLHPVINERGRVKNDDDTHVFTVSLKDCLACSGCAISEDEMSLLEHQNPDKILETIKEKPGFHVIVSTAAIANFSAARGISVHQSFHSIQNYFTELGASSVIHDGFWQLVWRYLLIKEYQKECVAKPFIISRCPGTVLYLERKTDNANYLAKLKPFPQLFALYEKSKRRDVPYILNITPCYDRKLEIGRFEGDIDGAISIGEIADKIKIVDNNDEIERFPIKNDVYYMIQKLGNGKEIKITKNGNIEEYTCGDLIGAYICGEASLRRLSSNIEHGNCKYSIAEINLCPMSCFSGGGLIRKTNPRERKKLVQETIKIHQSIESNDCYDENKIDSIVNDLLQLNIKTDYHTTKTNDDFTF